MPLADPTSEYTAAQARRRRQPWRRRQQPCALLCRAPPWRGCRRLQLHFAHSMTKMDDTHKNEQNSDYYAAVYRSSRRRPLQLRRGSEGGGGAALLFSSSSTLK